MSCVEFFYNNNKHAFIEHTFFFALIDRNLKMKFDVRKREKESQSVTEHVERMKQLHENMRYRLAEANERYAKQYNKSHATKTYRVSELI